MIGLYLHWAGADLAPPAAARFAASLATGTQHKPVSVAGEGTLFASACKRPHRPIHLPTGEILLFDGHIDNRSELRRELGLGLGGDDPALYAAAYVAWGEAADLRVVGEFAAIVCHPAQRRVRVVRAPLSAPPLHYYSDAERLIVASSARAIFATGEVAQAVNEQKIADSLFLNYREQERGWFKDVWRVPTGVRITFTAGRMVRDSYYDPLSLPPVRLGSDQEYVEAADALFEEGTRAALDGFSRPAISISGGFDSQAVAAYALRVMPEPARLLGLTSVPEEGWDGRINPARFGDESEHVRAFAAMHPRFDMMKIDAAGHSFGHHLQAMFLLGGTAPRNAGNLHWIHEVRATARARGCDVLLTGSMGNLSFSFDGRGTLQTLLRTHQWRALARELNAMKDGRSFARKLASVALPFAPAWIKQLRGRMRGDSPDIFDSICPLNRDYAAEMRVVERANDLGFDPWFRPPTTTRELRQAMLGNARNEAGDMQQALELLHGIPQRDPTAYRPLVEFCFSIPDDQYLRDGQSRWLARRMLPGMVPDMVLSEKRKGLQAVDWHLRLERERAELRDELDRLSADPAMAHRLNLPSLKAALDDWPKKTPVKAGAQHDRLRLALTRGITTARFIRFVEGTNAA